jgi:hypothetical protein
MAECPVCYKVLSKACVTCHNGHQICTSCFKKNDRGTCPICRDRYEPDEDEADESLPWEDMQFTCPSCRRIENLECGFYVCFCTHKICMDCYTNGDRDGEYRCGECNARTDNYGKYQLKEEVNGLRKHLNELRMKVKEMEEERAKVKMYTVQALQMTLEYVSDEQAEDTADKIADYLKTNGIKVSPSELLGEDISDEQDDAAD